MEKGFLRMRNPHAISMAFGEAVRKSIAHAADAHSRIVYKLEYRIDDDVLALLGTAGRALVVYNHVSMIDGVLLAAKAYLSKLWMRALVTHKFYDLFLLKFFLQCSGALRAGRKRRVSDNPELQTLLDRERKIHGELTKIALQKLLAMDWKVLVAPQGRIAPADDITIPREITTTWELAQFYPDMPIVIVTINGFGRSRLGGKDKNKYPIFSRPRATIHVQLLKEARHGTCDEFYGAIEDVWRDNLAKQP